MHIEARLVLVANRTSKMIHAQCALHMYYTMYNKVRYTCKQIKFIMHTEFKIFKLIGRVVL